MVADLVIKVNELLAKGDEKTAKELIGAFIVKEGRDSISLGFNSSSLSCTLREKGIESFKEGKEGISYDTAAKITNMQLQCLEETGASKDFMEAVRAFHQGYFFDIENEKKWREAEEKYYKSKA